MRNVQDEPPRLSQYLEFVVGAQHYCVDIMKVREVRLLESITPLAQVAEHICGVINLRGDIVPVVSLAMRLHGPAQAALQDELPASQQIALITDCRGELTAFKVDRILDVLTSERTEVQAVPKAIGGGQAQFIAGMLNIDERMIMVLDFERIIVPSVKPTSSPPEQVPIMAEFV